MAPDSDIGSARRRVTDGKRLVDEQRKRVTHLYREGANVYAATLLLDLFERSLKMFEDHLAMLEKDSPSRPK